MGLSRRAFLKLGGVMGAGAGAVLLERKMAFLQSAPTIENPLAFYPNRDWEEVYRDQYSYDDSFTYVCAPNCTHNCRLRAFVRNGVVMRIEPTYDGQRIGDLDGNQSTHAWNPRGCNKGYGQQRRMYGQYRLTNGPLVRAGWKEWADDGFPGLDSANRTKYRFDSRGTDTFAQITWEDAFPLIAKGMTEIADRYSGDSGRQILLEEGYQPEMIDEMEGAGTRTFKLRGGMGLLGVMGKYGMYRANNMMALLDVHVRGVDENTAKAGRNWSNYTWHGDQAPGHPFVHGLQTSDVDFNELRFTKLHVALGKNLIENKMADTHFYVETMERGGKIVTVSPEYSPPATKADYWIPCRPGLGDLALVLGVTRIIMERELYDEDFVKGFTDFPILIRTDTLKRLDPRDVFPDYQPGLSEDGPSFKIQGLKAEQYDQLQDYVVFDAATQQLTAVTREDVGEKMKEKGIDPELSYRASLTLQDGSEVEVLSLWEAYVDHLEDYDLDTAAEISGSPKDLIEQLAVDLATIKPACIHVGEGINHWFHATLHNRAVYLPMMLTGNIGKPGAGCHTWAGNYKAALWQSSKESGPGFKGWVAEDPFNPNLDENADGKDIEVRGYGKDEEPAYWDHGDQALIVETPNEGRKNFTGKSHMPTPTKLTWTTNVNLINNAKWGYGVLFNVLPRINMIITQDIEMTATCEYSDFILPANSWMEFEQPEVTASCSNPFLQIWKGRIDPVFDTKDDIEIMTEVAKALANEHNDPRFTDYWKFAIEGRTEVYLQRLLDASQTTRGYQYDEVMDGKFGEPGSALMMFQTYPRVPFWEQVHDSMPFHTDDGRMHSYCDIPEAIDYGENFIVHREGPEATPYLPNVIVSSNPLIRPNDYGILPEEMDPEMRTVRNIKLPWSEVKNTKNQLWEDGYRFYFLTPKTRHTVHSSWGSQDWMVLWQSNFADPYRADKRLPGVGDQQIHMNPEDVEELGLKDGDFVYVDANPADRPYIGWKPDDPEYKVARLMLRVKVNPSYPRGVTMTKHGGWISTPKTVESHTTRADGRAVSADTGYQSTFRFGSHQSVTKDWAMPMHQTDTLFHKKKIDQGFMFGGEADNHAINTVPKETLVRITKAEDGNWAPGDNGMAPANENEFMKRYIAGDLNSVEGA